MKKTSVICALLSFAAVACRSAPPRPLLQGGELSGWQKPSGPQAAHWRLLDGRLECDAPAAPIWTSEEFGDCEISLDVRVIEGRPTAVLFARGAKGFEIALEPNPSGEWTHVVVKLEDEETDVSIDGVESAGVLPGVAKKGPIGLSAEGRGRVEFARLTLRELR